MSSQALTQVSAPDLRSSGIHCLDQDWHEMGHSKGRGLQIMLLVSCVGPGLQSRSSPDGTGLTAIHIAEMHITDQYIPNPARRAKKEPSITAAGTPRIQHSTRCRQPSGRPTI